MNEISRVGLSSWKKEMKTQNFPIPLQKVGRLQTPFGNYKAKGTLQ
jgi:hypothetical protein